MLKLYQRVMSRCRTANQSNAAHIAFENRMTPLRLETLLAELRQAGQPEWRAKATRLLRKLGLARKPKPDASTLVDIAGWARRMKADCDAAGKARPERFARRLIAGSLALFTDGSPPGGKILLVCFCGGGHRMMMPLAIFLQHLDSTKVDVALVWDRQRQGYRLGIKGQPAGLYGLADRLPDLFDFRAYRSVRVMGASGGGMAAVLTGLRLGVDRVLCVGANSPDDPRWNKPGGPNARAMLAPYAGASGLPAIVAAFGDGVPKDRLAAETLASLVPATIVPISDPSGPVPHSALPRLVKQNKLAGFLATHLQI